MTVCRPCDHDSCPDNCQLDSKPSLPMYLLMMVPFVWQKHEMGGNDYLQHTESAKVLFRPQRVPPEQGCIHRSIMAAMEGVSSSVAVRVPC